LALAFSRILPVGALRRDIITQFLIEAMTLSAIGGIIGVLVGLGIALLVRNATRDGDAVVIDRRRFAGVDLDRPLLRNLPRDEGGHARSD